MMIDKSIVIAVRFLSAAYLFLWVGAYHHRKDGVDDWSLLCPYWCLDDSKYDEEGKSICRKRRVVAFLMAVLFGLQCFFDMAFLLIYASVL